MFQQNFKTMSTRQIVSNVVCLFNLLYSDKILLCRKNDHPKVLKMFPNAELHYIEGAGHWVHSEKPTEFLQICIEFLNK